MIWKAIGKRQRKADLPPSMKERPLERRNYVRPFSVGNHLDLENRGDVQLKPIRQNDTKDVQSEFNRNELSTRSMLGGFSSPNWDNCIQNASTNTVDEACYNHHQLLRPHVINMIFVFPSLLTTNHPIMILRRALQTRAYHSPNSSRGNRLDSPHSITQPATKQSTQQRPQIIDRDNTALE